MNRKIVSVLQKIKDEYGTDIFDNPRRVGALLNDFFQEDHAGERRLLVLILHTGLPTRMIQGHSFSEAELRSHADYIAKKEHFHKKAVIAALKCWQNVLSQQAAQKTKAPVQKKNKKQDQPQRTATPRLKSLLDLAKQGDAKAQFELGLLYENGSGGSKDHVQAVYWYRQSANQGFAEAQHSLGIMYYWGYGVPTNDALAVQWWLRAARQGHAEAHNRLGMAYQKGEGASKDYPQAVKFYRIAAEKGHAKAQYNLGVIYAAGLGVPQNYAQALELFQKAAGQGLAEGQYALGDMHKNGWGVPRDNATAAYWYHQAAAQGHVQAQNNLTNLDPVPQPAQAAPSQSTTAPPQAVQKPGMGSIMIMFLIVMVLFSVSKCASESQRSPSPRTVPPVPTSSIPSQQESQQKPAPLQQARPPSISKSLPAASTPITPAPQGQHQKPAGKAPQRTKPPSTKKPNQLPTLSEKGSRDDVSMAGVFSADDSSGQET